MNQPKWLKAMLKTFEGQEHEDIRKMSWEYAANVALANGRGFVSRAYNISTDEFDWHFGPCHWPMLHDPTTNERYTDDPFRGRRDDIPLEEFVRYLDGWYFPRKHGIEAS